jgi:hypothetical protein
MLLVQDIPLMQKVNLDNKQKNINNHFTGILR